MTTSTSTTDKNDFDDCLKKNLYFDLLFRSVLWVGFSLATAFLAVFHYGVQPLDYLERVSNALIPLVDTVGTFTLLLCLLAMLLKDLEVSLSNPDRKAATRGLLGGLVRRLAGDLSLWVLGALTTMLSAFIFTGAIVKIKPTEYVAVGGLGLILLIMTALVALGSICVRRFGPTPLRVMARSPWILTSAYIFVIGLLSGRLLLL